MPNSCLSSLRQRRAPSLAIRIALVLLLVALVLKVFSTQREVVVGRSAVVLVSIERHTAGADGWLSIQHTHGQRPTSGWLT